MAKELDKVGHDETVFTKSFGSHDDSDVPYDVVRVPNWQQTSFVSDLTILLFALIAIFQRRKSIDVLQCMMIYPVWFLGYINRIVTGIPYFAWIRCGDLHLMNDIWWNRWMMRQVFKDTLVVAQSQEIADDVSEDYHDISCNMEVLGNGVSMPDETAAGDDILYVGRLSLEKGVKYLISGSCQLRYTSNRRWGWPERKELEELADKNDISVQFQGFVDPESVGQFYKSAGIFVLPSTRDGMPNAILEAMTWGLPVVATNCGGVPNVVTDGETGYIVPPRDPHEMKIAIKELLEDPKKRSNFEKQHTNMHVKITYRNLRSIVLKNYMTVSVNWP